MIFTTCEMVLDLSSFHFLLIIIPQRCKRESMMPGFVGGVMNTAHNQ